MPEGENLVKLQKIGIEIRDYLADHVSAAQAKDAVGKVVDNTIKANQEDAAAKDKEDAANGVGHKGGKPLPGTPGASPGFNEDGRIYLYGNSTFNLNASKFSKGEDSQGKGDPGTKQSGFGVSIRFPINGR